MEYLKVFTDFVEVIETLGEAERGRLFTAMLKYAGQGIEPDFRGNERFVWPIAKQNIDRTVVEHEKHIAAKREAGLKGAAKRWQTMANDGSAISANSKNGENGYLKDKDKDKDKDNIIPPNSPPKGKRLTPPCAGEDLFERFWKAYPKKVGKGAALKAFEKAKVNSDLIVVIEKSIEQQKKTDQWKKENGQFIPNPATWLNQQRWEDEVPVKKSDDYDTEWVRKKFEYDMARLNKRFELGNIK